MRVRARWYSVVPRIPGLGPVAKAMLAAPYSKRQPSGFRLEEFRSSHIAGRFVERVEWDDEVDDPAGGRLLVHRVELRQARFRLTRVKPELELVEQPRSLTSFVSALSEVVGETLKLEVGRILPEAWLEALERHVGKVSVRALTTQSFAASATTSARVELVGTEDVRRHLSRFGGSGVSASRLVGVLEAPRAGRIELMGDGRAILCDLDDRATDAVRVSVRECWRPVGADLQAAPDLSE